MWPPRDGRTELGRSLLNVFRRPALGDTVTTKLKLLGAAAGLALVGTAAQAANLPVRKAAPGVCSAYGVGFFYIPGTETCQRVSGFAHFEYNVLISMK